MLFLSNPRGVKADRRKIVDTINQLNREQLLDLGDPEIATRIGQYEMAYKMQSSVPDLMDTSGETEDTSTLCMAQIRTRQDLRIIVCLHDVWLSVV